ncbi:MAG: glycerophosphodiester phosphodiesterase [Rhizobiales bacterium]|nr:glycerophosphodiester phosphodiesterase [Hyphomicrobiales bacterium]
MRRILTGLLILAAFIYLNNTNLFASRTISEPVLLAHRGIAQQFDMRDLRNDTCTASRMLPPTHELLENTIVSMRASFEIGADIVEIDVHPTTDGQFAVFHDWTVDCRSNGKGVTREHSMDELRRLDIGYGYTADGGKTFPFRGKGGGLMPSLAEVLATFPDRRFLINIKSNDPSEGQQLAKALGTLPVEHRERIMIYGGDAPIAALSSALPNLKTMSRNTLKTCLLSYIGYGWTGVVPEACQNKIVYLPINIAPWLWGWPNRFLSRMGSAGSSVFVIGPYHGGEFSAGIDTPDDFARLPVEYSGGIMTNEIETIASATGRSRRP